MNFIINSIESGIVGIKNIKIYKGADEVKPLTSVRMLI
jgi:hypothetical protein